MNELTDDEIKAGLALAYRHARLSPDPSTQVGAVIISNGESIASHNHPSVGFDDDQMFEFGEKAIIVEHAERSAIYMAALLGISTDGATMFAPWASCVDCARAIACSGIRRLVRHADIMRETPSRWTNSIRLADDILVKGGVDIIEWFGVVGEKSIRFDGGEWLP